MVVTVVDEVDSVAEVVEVSFSPVADLPANSDTWLCQFYRRRSRRIRRW